MITRDDIRQWLRAACRWWWLIIAAVVFAAGIALYLTQSATPSYVARTSLMIGNTLESQVPDQNQLSIGSALARYYGELSRREPILKSIQVSLNLPFSWEVISD